MAGKVDKSQTYFLRSTKGETWELWSFNEARQGHFVKKLTNPAETPADAVVALPARHTVSLLTWLSTNDAELIPNMLQLQMEQKGLLPRNGHERSIDFRMIETTPENRSLALVTALQSEFPRELTFDRAARFEPSPFTMPLLQDRVILWHEHDRITVAVTRGKDPVHFQILCAKELTQEALQELKCIVIELENHPEANPFLGVVMWGDFSSEESERVEKVLGLKVFQDSLPAPELPLVPSKLLPPQVELLHAKRKRRERIKKIATIAAGIYAIFLLSQVLYLGWQRFQAGQLRNRMAEQAPAVNTIQATAAKWQKLQWAIDPKVYPVELLLQAADLLPEEGMRLTSFEIEKGKVVIHGESSGAPAAFKFAEDIKSSPAMKMFQWDMPSPSLRPDGRADFIIEGEPKFAKIK